MIHRIAATAVASLILWFLWWCLTWVVGALLISVFSYNTAETLMGGLFWVGILCIPPLVWFRFRHVQ